jgi:DNA-binding GntR family transcriptional regulator
MAADNADNSIERRSLSEQLYSSIKKMILNQEIKGGEKIYEEKIADSFGVSRTPIREALRQLEKYGLVVLRPRQFAEVVKLKPEDRYYIGKLRIVLDTFAVEECILMATEEDCNHLESLAKETVHYAERGMHPEQFEKDSEFHLEIARISGNPYLLEMAQKLDVKVQLLRTTVYSTEEQIKSGPSHHLPLVKAIRNKDKKKARELIRTHLEQFYYRT